METLGLPPELLLWLDHPITKRAPPIPQDLVPVLKAYLEALTLAKYMLVAAFTLLIYDMILTYPSEVRFIWGSRWTFVRVAFTIVRYITPCVLILNLSMNFHPRQTAKACMVQGKVTTAVGMFCNSTATCILGLRVWAIWDQKLWMLALLLIIFLATLLPPSMFIWRELQVQSYANMDCFTTNELLRPQVLVIVDNPLPGILTGCVAYRSGFGTNWFHLYLCILTYDTSLFMLTILKAWILRRERIGIPIMTQLTRDGAWYFLVIMASVVLLIVETSFLKTKAAAILSLSYIATIAGASSRLLLRLREFCTPINYTSGRANQTTGRGASRWIGDIAMHDYNSRSDRWTAPEDEPEVVAYVTTDETSRVDV